MRWLLLFTLTACGESVPPSSRSVTSPIIDGAVVDTDAPLATTSVPTPTRVVTSTHGAAISVLALTEDGRVAASADVRSVRLWPSLDGKHEPVIVEMRPPLALAIARDADALAIAGLDAIGQLEVVRTTANGEQLSRAAVESVRPIRKIRAADQGILALRDDGAIALYAWDGTARGELLPAARERVMTFDARNNRAIAIVDTAGGVRGQWIELDARGVGRGARTPELPIVRDTVALSPDQLQIAGIDKRGSFVVADVATGRIRRKRELKEDDRAPLRVVGFLDGVALAADAAGNVVDMFGNEVEWSPEFREPPIVVGNRVAVGAAGASLVIARAGGEARFLGYRMTDEVTLTPRRDGFLVTDGDTVVDVGPELRARRTFEITSPEGKVYSSEIIDSDHVLAGYTSAYGNHEGHLLANVKSGKTTVLGPGDSRFDRRSGLFATRHEDTLEVRRYAPKTGTFSDAIEWDVEADPDYRWDFTWVNAKRGDLAIIKARSSTDRVEVDVIRLRPEPSLVKTLRVKPSPEWFNRRNADELLDEAWRPSRGQTSPDGTLIAEVRKDGRITLHGTDGTERWLVPAAGARDVTWTTGGELVAFGEGIARVDLATGVLLERQCGWRFGLWSSRIASMGPSTLCEAP
jgi:hypothetical protein